MYIEKRNGKSKVNAFIGEEVKESEGKYEVKYVTWRKRLILQVFETRS